jgi:hypothetical protein
MRRETMRKLERVADRCLGYLGLLLIGAISWVAERMGPAPQPAPGARARRVSPHQTPRRAAA